MERALLAVVLAIRTVFAILTERALLAVILAERTVLAVLAERALLAVILAIRTVFAVLAERALLAVVLAIRAVFAVLAERALLAVVLAERTVAGRLTIGALRLLLGRFFGLDRRFFGLFRLILLLLDALARLDLRILLRKLLCDLRIGGVLLGQLADGSCRHADVRDRAHRAACLADRAAEFQLAVRQRYAGNIRLIGVERGFLCGVRACIARDEHTAGLVVEARLAHQLVAEGQLARAARQSEHSQYRISCHLRPPVSSAARAARKPHRALLH